MRILASTFGEGDHNKLFEAMRRLPYDRIILIGDSNVEGTFSFRAIDDFERASGNGVKVEIVEARDFMGLVEDITEALQRHSRDQKTGEKNRVWLNISGGSKLLGDAALFAAFRLGVEAFHCDSGLTKLPVIRGATATDRFTSAQSRFLSLLRKDFSRLDDVAASFGAPSRQAVDRVIRELRRMDLIQTQVRGGAISLALSDAGEEVARALKRSHII